MQALDLRSGYTKTSRATGSGALEWRFFWRLHSFLGFLLVNDSSLLLEASSGENASMEGVCSLWLTIIA